MERTVYPEGWVRMEERIICEAGFIWRRVLARLERRVNELLADGTGWQIRSDLESTGILRARYIVRLGRPDPTVPNIVKP